MSTERWQERVEDILAAIAEIETFVADMSRSEFLDDVKTQKAVVASLTIIGEAARYVPEEVTRNTPDVPWALMRGMRNRIVHAYYQVDPEIVWNTCQNDLPPLVRPLKDLLPE